MECLAFSLNCRGCAHTDYEVHRQWFSLELQASQKITRIQIANNIDCSGRQMSNVSITIGPSKVYDPNEPQCLPVINVLVHGPSLQDYFCTGDLHKGKFIKISREGVMSLCEARVYTLPEGESQVQYHSG